MKTQAQKLGFGIWCKIVVSCKQAVIVTQFLEQEMQSAAFALRSRCVRGCCCAGVLDF
jgi:hypothetical protein